MNFPIPNGSVPNPFSGLSGAGETISKIAKYVGIAFAILFGLIVLLLIIKIVKAVMR